MTKQQTNNSSCILCNTQRAEKPIKCVGESTVSDADLGEGLVILTQRVRLEQEPQYGDYTMLTATSFCKLQSGDSV